MFLKKVAVFSLIASISFFFVVATSDQLFSYWNSLPIAASSGTRGDLYSLTYLRPFKEYDYLSQSTLSQPNYKKSEFVNDTHLYLIGDSFIKDIAKEQYISQKTTFIRIGVESKQIELDTSKTNILIIQNIERGICDRFRDDMFERTFMGTSGYYTKDTDQKIINKGSKKQALLKDFKVGDIEDRLQHIIFGYAAFGLIKEAKAALNFYCFDRITGNHIVSTDKKYLLYHNEADKKVGLTSSFSKLEEKQIKEYVHNSEHITAFYKKMGFNKVLYVFVPNKVSIVAPNDGTYNHQVERIQRYKTPLFKTIDIYSTMVGHPQFYHKGDGHWNKTGKALFVKTINEIIRHPDE